ncbi:hypothetical protein ACLQ20_20965 [Micromonospora sp. DT46]|uniref:hypothetical protein n=1 Tax=unclassified Micromonospora TaxID=2617518 RepID=UPI001788E358|nr:MULTISPECIES: hypothetical protein [unclassified Micromonospora]WSG01356.1 hypothetical protein OG989_27340 [Micromonospora sp. NBC_01740]
MSAGTVVRSPDGSDIVLGEVGQRVLLANSRVRVWEVALAPGECQPWHLHRNPYLVLCLDTSACRMDWLDGSPPRHINEQVGGAIYRPVSPVHMLTNQGHSLYRNRLVELLDLGEEASGEAPYALPDTTDGWPGEPAHGMALTTVLDTDGVRVQRLTTPPDDEHTCRAESVPLLVVDLAGGADADTPPRPAVRYLHPGETHNIRNPNRTPIDTQIVELRYLRALPAGQ